MKIEIKLVNMTPHELNVTDVDGNIKTIPPSGQVARVKTDSLPQEVKEIETEFGTFSVSKQILCNAVENVPPKSEGTVYVVSRLVKDSLKDRTDLICPGTLLRDSEGVVKGCEGFTI